MKLDVLQLDLRGSEDKKLNLSGTFFLSVYSLTFLHTVIAHSGVYFLFEL